MQARRLTDVELFSRGAAWDSLLAASRADAFFLRHGVLAAWWRHFGSRRRLFAIEVHHEGRLIGFAPLCLSSERAHGVLPIRELAFLGREALTADHLDVVALPGLEAAVAEAVLEHLFDTREEWDLLRLSELRDGSPTPALLETFAERRGLSLVPAKGQVCPYLPLPGDWDALLAGVSANLRSTLRRREKKLKALGATFAEKRGDDVLPALDRLFELHGARWRTRGRTGNFVDPRVRALHRELAPALDREGALGLWTVEIDGRVAASIYGFVHRRRFHYFQAGFDPAFAEHGVGVALMGHAVRRCIERGLVEFDYLRGDEEYKRRWTALRRETRSLVLAPPSLTAFAWSSLGAARRRATRWWRPAEAPATVPSN